MTVIALSDTACPPPPKLRFATPNQVFAEMRQLADLIQIRPRANEGHLAFLARLRSSTTPEEAITFTSFAALPPVSAGWGYECLRQMADHLHPSERPLMHEIATWIANPTTSQRHKLMRDALWAPSRSPSVLLGLAVGWSLGGPAPNDPLPPPAWRTPQAVNSAILSCLARAELTQRSVLLARLINMAETIFYDG